MSIPSGDYGATSGNKAGLAKTGFGFGLEYDKPIENTNLNLVFTGLLNSHSVDASEIEKNLQSYDADATVDVGSYLLFWITAGIGFQSEMSPNANLYGNLQIGLLHGKVPEMTMTLPSSDIKGVSESASSTVFGLGIGGGIIFSDKYDIGLHYYTAEPEYEVTTKTTSSTLGNSSSSIKAKQPTASINLLFGYVL